MPTESAPKKDQDIDLLDLSLTFLRHKKFIFGGTLAFTIVIAVACLVMSPMYEAATILMPPQQTSASMAGQLLSAVGGSLSGLVGAGATTNTGDLYVGLLKSPVILDPIIDRFDLMHLYDLETRVETRKTLAEEMITLLNDMDNGGIVWVTVQDTDPQRAMEMSQAFVGELTKLFDKVGYSDAGRRRIYFEKELKKANEALSDAEQDFQTFQEGSGVIKIDDQSSAVLQGIASLRAQIAAKEVQMQVMRTYATGSNPDVKKADEEVHALKEQLKKLEEKESNYSGETLIPTGQIPSLGTEYLRKIREFKFRQDLYELLIKQYEASRLDEAREAGVVQVASPATLPDKKAKPKLILIVALAWIVGFILFTTAGYGFEFVEKVKGNPENDQGLRSFKRLLTRL